MKKHCLWHRAEGKVVEAAAAPGAYNTGDRRNAVGDGKICVCPVDGALRVRTCERDHDAV